MRNFTALDVEQRSEAWKLARCGRLTASRAGDALSFLKGGSESAARRDYRNDLVAERLSGEPCESGYTNADMERGVALEPAAIAAYEAHVGNIVEPVGFLAHTQHMAGYSPDGWVNGGQGLVEVKAPRTATHLKYLRSRTVPAEYLAQCTHALWLTGAEWIDFVSYCPKLPAPLDLVVIRMVRDVHALADFEGKALCFLSEVDAEVAALRTLANLPAVLAESVAVSA